MDGTTWRRRLVNGLGDGAKAAVQSRETTRLVNREASDTSPGSTIENTSYDELIFGLFNMSNII